MTVDVAVTFWKVADGRKSRRKKRCREERTIKKTAFKEADDVD